MKKIQPLSPFFLLIFLLLFYSCRTEKPTSPNVILVITDDQGYGDLGVNGNPYIKTPNIDQFANEAVRLTNFHVSTTCAPTRGALMSGRHTNRLNVFHTISGRSLLFEDEVILPEIFEKNGYATGMFGKWHLGDNYPFRPEDRGFQEVVRHGGGGISQGPDYWGNDYFDDHYWHNGMPEEYSGYCTDVFFAEAMKFIELNQEKPFFCYISTNAPHGPLNLPESYLDLYAGNENLPRNAQRFYGMITNIDDNFGMLLEKLEVLGIADNTILVFMTDNGTANGEKVFNAGMRGKKGSEYEGGHRVPFMIRWRDGDIAGGGEIDQLTAHFDVLPTLTDLLDLDFSPKKELDGISWKPLLTGDEKRWPDRILYVDTQRLQNLVKERKYSVMQNHWRLVNGSELYHLTEDPGQQNNIIEAHEAIATLLADGYENWWSSIMSEEPNERYAYITAGTEHENPVRISAHDMLTGNHGRAWHQYGVAQAAQAAGIWKIEIAEHGDYRIGLRRFPRESGLAIDAVFPAEEKTIELDQVMPASRDALFKKASLYIADINQTKEIHPGEEEIIFEGKLPRGKFDMEARLIDNEGRVHPAYYIYIEKL